MQPEIRQYNKAEAEKSPDSIEVHTYPKPTDPSTRIASIQRTRVDAGSKSMVVTDIVDRQPMSHADAMQRAIDFAQNHGVPVIFERKDEQPEVLDADGSSAAGSFRH